MKEKARPSGKKPRYLIKAFRNQKSFRAWLDKNHNKSNGLWLRFFKKDSGKNTITHAEALDEALCFGWIDGQGNRFDNQSWVQKFTPRRAKSGWSQVNIKHAERLMKSQKMRTAGLKQVEDAKADGRWEKAYPSQGSAELPDDFIKRLNENRKAKAFFKTLNRQNVYAIIYRLHTAKRPETRQRRMDLIFEMLLSGRRFHP